MSGTGLDLAPGPFHAVRGRRGEHEPHVQEVVSLVVVRHLVESVDLGRHRVELVLAEMHGAQRYRPAHALGVVHGTEARQRAPFQQAFDALEKLAFLEPEPLRRLGKGPLAHRDAVLQPVDEGPIDLIHDEFPSRLARWTLYSVRRAGGSGGG